MTRRLLTHDELDRFEHLRANAHARYDNEDDEAHKIEPIGLEDLRPPNDDGPCSVTTIDGTTYYLTPTQLAYIFNGDPPADG